MSYDTIEEAIEAFRSDDTWRLREDWPVLTQTGHVIFSGRVHRQAGMGHRDVARMMNKLACRLHALLMELTPGGLNTEMTVNKAESLLEHVEIADQVTRQRW